MTNLSKKLEVTTNIAILCVTVLIGVVAINQNRSMATGSPRPQIRVGQKVPITDIDWAKKSRHLVLAVSSTCFHCTESASFYQRLTRQAEKQSDLEITAVFPQSVEEGKTYLKKLAVPIENVRHVRLEDVPIAGTPTILLVNARGNVEKVWFGKLPPEKESEVMKEVGCTQSCV